MAIILALCVILPNAFAFVFTAFELLSGSFVFQRDVRRAESVISGLVLTRADEPTRGFGAVVADRSLADDERQLGAGEEALRQFFGDATFFRESAARRDLEDFVRVHAAWRMIAGRSPEERRMALVAEARERADMRDLLRILEEVAGANSAETVWRFVHLVSGGVFFVAVSSMLSMALARRQERLENDLRHQRMTADAYQVAALPRALPEVPGCTFSAVYEPAVADSQVGGDWFDAFRLVDGRLMISIGDVAGFGLAASVTMAAVRQNIRAAAEMNPDPAMILDAADRALVAERPDVVVTAFLCVYDPVALTLSYASAGHPSPMVRSPAGHVVELAGGGLPLGLRSMVPDETSYVDFPVGSFMLLYTDGLSEASRDILGSLGRMRLLLTDDAVVGASDPARALYTRMLPRGTPDDVAILTFRTSAGPAGVFQGWEFLASDAGAAAACRREVVSCLGDAAGGNPSDCFSAELVFGELLGNVVRYAGGWVRVVLDFSGRKPVLHVLDRGPGFVVNARLPSDSLSDRGRGLFLVKSLSEDFGVSRRFPTGSHARVVLRVGSA